MWHVLLATDRGLAGPILRLALGIAILPHGAQKLLGWFGGKGFSATMASFTQDDIPWILALLVIMSEFFGSLGVLVGLLTRVAAFGIGCVMAVAAVTVHAQHGFFMNWFGNKQGEGFEYHILAFGIALALVVRGGGRWSIDGALTGQRS